MTNASPPTVRVTDDRIYCDLGDGWINFRDLEHMTQQRELYRKIIKRGSVQGSATFTAENMESCRRRFNNIVEAIAEVRRLKGL